MTGEKNSHGEDREQLLFVAVVRMVTRELMRSAHGPDGGLDSSNSRSGLQRQALSLTGDMMSLCKLLVEMRSQAELSRYRSTSGGIKV